MNSSRKIFLCFMLLGGLSLFLCSALAGDYIYIPEHEIYSKGAVQHTLDESKARLMLASIKNMDLSQIWFATGMETYYRNPACVTGESIWTFSKPTLSSAGIWRGKKGYISEVAKDKSETTCNQLADDPRGFLLGIKTATFIDPDSIHPEEAWDGTVPGIFQIYNDISDDELNHVASVISQVRKCLAKNPKCPYTIDSEGVSMSQHDMIATMNTGNLVSLEVEPGFGLPRPCYSMIFQKPGPWVGLLGMHICYRGDKQVTKISLSTDIVE